MTRQKQGGEGGKEKDEIMKKGMMQMQENAYSQMLGYYSSAESSEEDVVSFEDNQQMGIGVGHMYGEISMLSGEQDDHLADQQALPPVSSPPQPQPLSSTAKQEIEFIDGVLLSLCLSLTHYFTTASGCIAFAPRGILIRFWPRVQ